MASIRDFLPRWLGGAEHKEVTFEGGLSAFLALNLDAANYQTGRNFANTVRYGLSANPYLFRAVMVQARAVAGIPWVLYQLRGADREDVGQHPAIHLLNVRANTRESAPTFWQYLVGDGLLAGDAFVYAVRDGRGIPTELYTLRPDWVTAKYDSDGTLTSYEYGYGTRKQTFQPEDVLHIGEYNPLREGVGIAPAKVVARAVDQFTAADDWNTALLQNMGRTPGMLAPKEGVIDVPQQEALKKELQEKYSGPKNAGRPLVFRGPLVWQQMGTTPTDMDWGGGKDRAMRQIAVGLGVAPELLGDGQAKTYNNVREARAALYTEDIFPRMDMYKAALRWWLLPMFGLDPASYELDYDRDEVEAIQEDRGLVWERAASADFLTVNEKREMLGYPPVADGDVVLIPNNLVPLDETLAPTPTPAPQIHILPGGTQPPSPATDNPVDTGGTSTQQRATGGTDGKTALTRKRRGTPGALKNTSISPGAATTGAGRS